MSDRELMQALRELIARHEESGPNPHQLTTEIARRDHVRIKIVAWLVVLLWVIGVSGLVWQAYLLNQYAIAASFNVRSPSQPKVAPPKEPAKSEQPSYDFYWQEWDALRSIHHSAWYIAGSAGSLLLAGFLTIFLVTTSRKATLAQINVNLADISEQLRQMRQIAGNSAGEISSSPLKGDAE